MDHDRFDSLARSVFAGARRSRRAALGAVLGAALLHHEPESVIASKRRKWAKGAASAQAADACYPNPNCKPGRGKNASRCDFSFSTLFQNLDARGANLSKSSFAGSDLRGADFRGANLSDACFVSANLTGAKLGASVNLRGAVFCNTTMPDGSVNDRGCQGETPCCHLRLQDCPDAVVSCWQTNEIGECGAFVGQFGPVGHCWQILSGCCPCDHRDSAYWTEQCNKTYPACNGKCIAQDEEQFAACFVCPSD